MEKSDKQKRIKREISRLKKIFKDVDANKLDLVKALIERAAYITVSLQDIEEQLNMEGWTEEYNNGRLQSGLKKSAAAECHISLVKNLNAIMKQLLEIVPPAKDKESRLDALLRE